MALSDHFRELRARLLRAITVLILAHHRRARSSTTRSSTSSPRRTVTRSRQLNKGIDSRLVSNDVGGPLMIQLKLCTFVAIGATSPYWLWQIWAFILPGLHPRERKWSWVFISVAGPLFLAGMALGYFILPKGLAVLIGFTQTDVTNLVDVGRLVDLHDPDAAGVRAGVRDPAVRGAAQPGRRPPRARAAPATGRGSSSAPSSSRPSRRPRPTRSRCASWRRRCWCCSGSPR